MANEVKVRISAEDATAAAFRSVQSSLKQLQSGAGAALATIGVLGAGLSVAGIVGSLKASVDAMDALNDAADQTGSSVEDLSSLLNTLAPYGATVDQITDATGRLARAMAGADDETKGAGAAFAALGVATRDASGNLRPTVDVLTDVAKALDLYEDGTNKTVIAQQLFGKTGASLLPLLKDLAGAERVAATVTSEQAAEAERLNVELGRLKVAFEGLKVSIGGPLLTALNDLIQQFREGKEAAGGFWEALFRFGLKYGPDKSPADRVTEIGAEIERLNRQIREDEAKLNTEGPVYGARYVDRIARARDQLAQLQRDIEFFGRQVARDQSRDPALRASEDRGFKPPRDQAPNAGGRGASDEARKAAAAYRELDALIRQAAIDDELKQQADAAKDLAQQLDRAADAALRRLAAVDRAEQDADEALSNEIERTLDLVNATRALYRERDRIADLEAAGLPPEAGNARRAQINSQIDGILSGQMPQQIKEATDAARELGLTFASAFEDAALSGGKLSDVLKGLVDDISRVFLRKTVTEPLAGLASSLFSNLFGGFGGARASGGPVSAGLTYLVGERGPELFMPKASGAIVPNGKFGGGGTVVVNQTISYGGNDRAGALALASAVKADTLRAMREAQLRGVTA